MAEPIESHHLDMTHETERVGSPQTLVCTNTRKHFQERCRQYAVEIDLMKQLLALGEQLPGQLQDLLRRLREAVSRSQGS
jgi:hypothetical protein